MATNIEYLGPVGTEQLIKSAKETFQSKITKGQEGQMLIQGNDGLEWEDAEIQENGTIIIGKNSATPVMIENDGETGQALLKTGLGAQWSDLNIPEIPEDIMTESSADGRYEMKGTCTGLHAEMQEDINKKADNFTIGSGLEMSEDRVLSIKIDDKLWVIVSELPVQPATGNENKIHLVLAESDSPVSTINTDVKKKNIYNEYIWISDVDDGYWEQTGQVSAADVELEGYLTEDKAAETYVAKEGTAIDENSVSIEGNSVDTVVVTGNGTEGQFLQKNSDGTASWTNVGLDEIENKADWGTTLEDYRISDAYISEQKIQLGDNGLNIIPIENEGEPGQYLVKKETGGAEWATVDLNAIQMAINEKADASTTLEGYDINDAYIDENRIQLGANHVETITITDDGLEGTYKFLMKTDSGAQWTTLDNVVNSIIKNYLSDPANLSDLKEALENA